MEPRRPVRATRPASANGDVTEVVRAVLIDVLALEPGDFDPERSLAEMGCSSLDMIDVQYRLENQLGASDLGLDGSLDFDPLRAPIRRLEEYVRAISRA